ncbi:MAG: hypothetical protein ACYTEL_09575 [Planctomycetota bacterium]|jgi:hypothetical protein
MARVPRNVAILAGFVFCVALLAGVGADPMTRAFGQSRGQSSQQAEDQFENSRIRIEVFVAEVKLEALYKAGISPIGQKPNAVSVDNILQCLVQKDGKVVAGAKLAVGQNEKGRIDQRKTIYVGRQHQRRTPEGTTTQTVFEDYSAGMVFGAKAVVTRPDRIGVNFSFNQSEFDFSKQDNAPPDKVNREWNGDVTLEAGVPSIVGATQNEEAATFLILTADIK